MQSSPDKELVISSIRRHSLMLASVHGKHKMKVQVELTSQERGACPCCTACPEALGWLSLFGICPGSRGPHTSFIRSSPLFSPSLCVILPYAHLPPPGLTAQQLPRAPVCWCKAGTPRRPLRLLLGDIVSLLSLNKNGIHA